MVIFPALAPVVVAVEIIELVVAFNMLIFPAIELMVSSILPFETVIFPPAELTVPVTVIFERLIFFPFPTMFPFTVYPVDVETRLPLRVVVADDAVIVHGPVTF